MGEVMIPVNIEEIMSQIRKEIEDAGYTDDMLSFDDVVLDNVNFRFESFNLEDFQQEVYDLNQRWNIQTYRKLNSNCVVAFLKKIIRKLIRFYVDPVVEDQNRFNANVVKSMNLMNCYIKEQNATIQALENRVKKLEEENRSLKQ